MNIWRSRYLFWLSLLLCLMALNGFCVKWLIGLGLDAKIMISDLMMLPVGIVLVSVVVSVILVFATEMVLKSINGDLD